MDPGAVLTLTISLFFILDPFASLPMFISITKGSDRKTVRSYANRAIIVAAVILFIFMFVGDELMDIFGITMDSFRVAGGIILLLMGVELVFSLKLSKGSGEQGAPWVIIATPILTGPGMITASILFASQYGVDTVLVSGLLALFFTWIILRCASSIMKAVGEQAIGIASKIIGLLIAAMAVEYIFEGTYGWIRDHGAETVVIIASFL